MNDLDDYLDYYNDEGFNKLQKWFGQYYENLVIIIICVIVLICNV